MPALFWQETLPGTLDCNYDVYLPDAAQSEWYRRVVSYEIECTVIASNCSQGNRVVNPISNELQAGVLRPELRGNGRVRVGCLLDQAECSCHKIQ